MHNTFAMEIARAFQNGASIRELAEDTSIPEARIEARIRAILTILLNDVRATATKCYPCPPGSK